MALALLLLCAIPLTEGARAEISAGEVIGASGGHFTIGGVAMSSPLWGVDETTLLPFAIWAHVNGWEAYWGYNMNFPGPDMEEGWLDCDNLLELFHQFFWLCQHYGVELVRLGWVNGWATEIAHEAAMDHPDKLFDVLDTMMHEACEHDVYLELTLAGTAGYPAYDFGKGTNPLDQTSTAYAEYVRYAATVIHMVENSSHDQCILAYDAWNEPDHDTVNTGWWAGDEAKFHRWAENVSADLCPLTTHLVDLGINWDCNLWEFSYGDFLNATAAEHFDMCSIHIYASAEYDPLWEWPIAWALAAGKPLLVGEVAYNGAYPFSRWTWYETHFFAGGGEALCSMVLRGTASYPFEGVVPGDEEPGGTSTGPEEYPEGGGGGGGGGNEEPPVSEDVPLVQGLRGLPIVAYGLVGLGLIASVALWAKPVPRARFLLGLALLGGFMASNWGYL